MDDERVLRSYMRLLSPEHRLLIARDGGDAIELLESGAAPDAVLVEPICPASTAGSCSNRVQPGAS
jgi:hypothetical protein